jgi:hypothetical protein
MIHLMAESYIQMIIYKVRTIAEDRKTNPLFQDNSAYQLTILQRVNHTTDN